jgi:Ca-activated chloride channel homolog
MMLPKPLKSSLFAFALLAGAWASASGQSAAQSAQQSVTSGAQQSASPEQQNANPAQAPINEQPFVLKKSVSEVVLNVTVMDEKGRAITTLPQTDFRVYEDNVEQKILSFHSEDIPVSLGLLIDDSGSMLSKRAAVNKAALDLVKQSNPADETFVINFADEAFLDQDFTSDLGKLQEALGHIDSRGGTAIFDAVSASADHLAKFGKRQRQAIVIITDGMDQQSTLRLDDVVRRVQSLGGPVVYAVGLLFGEKHTDEKRAKRDLQTLATQTGGMAYFPKSLDDVDAICAQVARDIRNQYVIGYRPTRPASEGGYRAVKVDVKAHGFGKLAVRTRPGYFANAPAAK